MTPFIESLGECRYLSPLGRAGPGVVKFKTDRDQILCDDRANDGLETGRVSQLTRAFEIAGPRERIYFDPEKTVAALVTCGGLLGVDILFTIGGDGTLKGASAMAAEIERRGLRKSVIGIPKTIDNDIEYLDKSFGFETAFAKAVEAVSCAHVEAICAHNGNFLTTDSSATDASGNKRLGDIGIFLRDKIIQFFDSRNIPITLKYIDPSYAIRSVPASPQDNVYCSILAQNAVHAGMAGKTNMLVGRWHDSYVHIPLKLVTQSRRKIDPEGDVWRFVLEATGQPARML